LGPRELEERRYLNLKCLRREILLRKKGLWYGTYNVMGSVTEDARILVDLIAFLEMAEVGRQQKGNRPSCLRCLHDDATAHLGLDFLKRVRIFPINSSRAASGPRTSLW